LFLPSISERGSTATSIAKDMRYTHLSLCIWDSGKNMGKNGERGKLGQERLEVGWEVVMFLFNIVNLNV
jgi:hypothetical protein